MPDEAGQPEQGNQTFQQWKLRRWGKKKSSVSEQPAPAPTPPPSTAPAPPASTSTETPPAPKTPAIPVNKPAAEPKETPSIFNRKKKKEETQAEEEKEEVLTTEFSESQLQEAWISFKEKRTAEGVSEMEQLILNRPIRKSGEHNALISLASPLETNILERAEQYIVQHLRTELKNTLLLIEKEVKEQETTKKLYTSKDKFEYMAEQNPALKEMKERLGLDFDY